MTVSSDWPQVKRKLDFSLFFLDILKANFHFVLPIKTSKGSADQMWVRIIQGVEFQGWFGNWTQVKPTFAV